MLNLKKKIQGAFAQVNPFDGGKTYGSFNPPMKAPLPMAAPRATAPASRGPVHGPMQGTTRGQLPIFTGELDSTQSAGLPGLRKAQDVQRGVEVENDRMWGRQLFEDTASEQGYTPDFKGTVMNADPRHVKHMESFKSGTVGKAAGFYRPPMVDDTGKSHDDMIAVASGGFPSQQRNVATHEGLHTAFETKPEVRAPFAEAFKSAPPELKRHLGNTLKAYEGFPGPQALEDYNNLPFQYQTEVHSFIPEFYQNQQPRIPMKRAEIPRQLADYYSQHFNLDNFPGIGANQQVAMEPARRVMRAPNRRIPLFTGLDF